MSGAKGGIPRAGASDCSTRAGSVINGGARLVPGHCISQAIRKRRNE